MEEFIPQNAIYINDGIAGLCPLRYGGDYYVTSFWYSSQNLFLSGKFRLKLLVS